MKINPCNEKSPYSRLKKGEKCYSSARIKKELADPWAVGIVAAESFIDYSNYDEPLQTTA
jgi:hypothetical protein